MQQVDDVNQYICCPITGVTSEMTDRQDCYLSQVTGLIPFFPLLSCLIPNPLMSFSFVQLRQQHESDKSEEKQCSFTLVCCCNHRSKMGEVWEWDQALSNWGSAVLQKVIEEDTQIPTLGECWVHWRQPGGVPWRSSESRAGGKSTGLQTPEKKNVHRW